MQKQLLVITFIFSAILTFVTCQQKKTHEIVSPVLVSKYARPLTNIHFASSPQRLERGKYLVNGVLRCFHCHAGVDTTEPGWPPIPGQLGSGRALFLSDSFHLYAPNITPNKETGAGTWTDDMFARALRDGIGHDGRALITMPYWVFKSLGDEDLASVIVYIRSIPAIKNQLPPRLLVPDWEKYLQTEMRSISDAAVPQPDTSTDLAKGRYLARIGECIGCHTAWYKRNPGYFGGGNTIANVGTDSVIVSANISSDITGIGGWDDETFIRVIRTGKGGILHRSMPWVAFKNISDHDLRAILVALKSTNPVEHSIVNGIKPTFCEVCGQYHGYGDHNKKKPIIAVKEDTNRYPSYVGTYVTSDKDTMIISSKANKTLWVTTLGEGAKTMELIPIANNKFNASGLPSPISFTRNASGLVTGLVDYDLDPATFLKSK